MSDKRLVMLNNTEIAKINDCLLFKKNYLNNLKQIKNSIIENMNNIINYTNKSILEEIEEINNIYNKLQQIYIAIYAMLDNFVIIL